MSKGQLTPAEN